MKLANCINECKDNKQKYSTLKSEYDQVKREQLDMEDHLKVLSNDFDCMHAINDKNVAQVKVLLDKEAKLNENIRHLENKNKELLEKNEELWEDLNDAGTAYVEMWHKAHNAYIDPNSHKTGVLTVYHKTPATSLPKDIPSQSSTEQSSGGNTSRGKETVNNMPNDSQVKCTASSHSKQKQKRGGKRKQGRKIHNNYGQPWY